MKTKKLCPCLICLFLLSIQSPSPAEAQGNLTHDQYIRQYQSIAIENMKQYRIPASIIMAQALLESGGGNSTLARSANNHFGIKCKSDWNGEYILHDDNQSGECFRKYGSVNDSYADHAEFLKNSSRYGSLFELDKSDYENWAKGLQTAGYATDPQYAARLISLIEQYDLYKLDNRIETDSDSRNTGIPGNGSFSGAQIVTAQHLQPYQGPKTDVSVYPAISAKGAQNRLVFKNNGADFIITREGDTFESLAAELNKRKSNLLAYNDLNAERKLSPGQMVYISPKKKKAGNGFSTYSVEKGDNLYSISQKFGIRFDRLCKLNNMPREYEVHTGQLISLR